MPNIHRSGERGSSELGWLHSRFSFSFADYYNPKRMGFGALRVLNDDIIEPGTGFGSHSHANMEIVSIPTEGALAHKDSTGVEEVVHENEIQVMSAGSGITHSEYNHSQTKPAKFFQIWIQTKEKNISPRHDKKRFKLPPNSLQTLVSGFDKNTLYIHQNAKISLAKFDSGKQTTYETTDANGVFIFVITGRIQVEGETLEERDSLEITQAKEISINALEDAYYMIIEVPME